MSDLVERLRSNSTLVICPFNKKSPEYFTTPNDQPCKFCGGLPEGPDKCTGADMRVMLEAADRIEALEAELAKAREAALEEAAKLADAASTEWTSDAVLWRESRMAETAKVSLHHAKAASLVAEAIRRRALQDKEAKG